MSLTRVDYFVAAADIILSRWLLALYNTLCYVAALLIYFMSSYTLYTNSYVINDIDVPNICEKNN